MANEMRKLEKMLFQFIPSHVLSRVRAWLNYLPRAHAYILGLSAKISFNGIPKLRIESAAVGPLPPFRARRNIRLSPRRKHTEASLTWTFTVNDMLPMCIRPVAKF
jgi:hypothetical protein